MGVAKAPPTLLLLAVLPLIFAQKITDLDQARQYLAEYNEEAMRVYYTAVEASWGYNTNITDETQRKSVSILIKLTCKKNMGHFLYQNVQ